MNAPCDEEAFCDLFNSLVNLKKDLANNALKSLRGFAHDQIRDNPTQGQRTRSSNSKEAREVPSLVNQPFRYLHYVESTHQWNSAAGTRGLHGDH